MSNMNGQMPDNVPVYGYGTDPDAPNLRELQFDGNVGVNTVGNITTVTVLESGPSDPNAVPFENITGANTINVGGSSKVFYATPDGADLNLNFTDPNNPGQPGTVYVVQVKKDNGSNPFKVVLTADGKSVGDTPSYELNSNNDTVKIHAANDRYNVIL